MLYKDKEYSCQRTLTKYWKTTLKKRASQLDVNESMMFISNKRLLVCCLGLAVSALAATFLKDWLFFSTTLFEHVTTGCIKSGTDYLECAYQVRFTTAYIVTGALIACPLSYFWYRLLTAKAKEIHYDTLLAVFISILIVRILFSVGIHDLWSDIVWSLIYVSGAAIHFFAARKIINKALKEDRKIKAAS